MQYALPIIYLMNIISLGNINIIGLYYITVICSIIAV